MMKVTAPLLPRSLFASLLVSLLWLHALNGTPARTPTPIDPGQTLHITLHHPSGDLSIDDFAYLEQAIRAAFTASGYSGDLKIKRWGAHVDEGSQSLHLSVILWKEWVPGEYQCRLYLTAKTGEDSHDLGVVVGRTTGLITSSERFRQILLKSATEGILQAIKKLNEAALLTPPAET